MKPSDGCELTVFFVIIFFALFVLYAIANGLCERVDRLEGRQHGGIVNDIQRARGTK